MSKVSIGLRGWRFDEGAVLEPDGDLKPLREMPEDARERVSRLATLVNEPCDACWLVHGEAERGRCNVAQVVYGEPLGEVLLCDDHEADFVYWFREADGSELAGSRNMRNAFHAWFHDGGRAPEGYEGVEHVETDPDAVPKKRHAEELPSLEEEIAGMSQAERDALGIDLSDVDLDVDPDVDP